MPNGDRIVENDQSVDTRSVLKRIHNHTQTQSNAPISQKKKIRYSCPKIGKSQRCTGRTLLCEKERTISQNTIEQFAADRFECAHTQNIFVPLLWIKDKNGTIGPMCNGVRQNDWIVKIYVPSLCVPFADPLFQLYWKVFFFFAEKLQAKIYGSYTSNGETNAHYAKCICKKIETNQMEVNRTANNSLDCVYFGRKRGSQ